jgi:hypothetical protein
VVVLWQGYVTGQYQAYDPAANEPFLSSPPFRTWRPPWAPNVPLEDSPAAAAAFRSLANELSRRGWRRHDSATVDPGRSVFVRPAKGSPPGRKKRIDPARIADPFVLRALAQAAGAEGATAAEVGEALYGDESVSVRGLPQQMGRRLARLEAEGKVSRRAAGGVTRWAPASLDRGDDSVSRP